MASYSAFFSSGLQAPSHYSYYDSIPSSPLPLPDDSDIEIDSNREHTPTPDLPLPPPPPAPRLRKRRSSLTVATNPMTAIRSPTRTAAAALQLQLHLPTSPSRSRSGSLGTANVNVNVASEGTSLVGRMRSGSVGHGPRFPARRLVRRLASVPAPAPPPTAPLPAVPPSVLGLVPHHSFAPSAGSAPASTITSIKGTGTRPALAAWRSLSDAVIDTVGSMTKARERAFSIGAPAGGRIDEEMKEN